MQRKKWGNLFFFKFSLHLPHKIIGYESRQKKGLG